MAQHVVQYSSPYLFKRDNNVVITHIHNGNLRISPNNHSALDGGGACGMFARWKVHLANKGV